MAIIISNENSIEIDGTIMPLNSRDVTRLSNGVRISKSGANSYIDIPLENTTIDGVPAESVDSLMDFFRSKGFSLGGGDGSNGVASVSGNIVDDSDPENPVVNITAGSNVSISGNEISSTDTTYSAGDNIVLNGNEFSLSSDIVDRIVALENALES